MGLLNHLLLGMLCVLAGATDQFWDVGHTTPEYHDGPVDGLEFILRTKAKDYALRDTGFGCGVDPRVTSVMVVPVDEPEGSYGSCKNPFGTCADVQLCENKVWKLRLAAYNEGTEWFQIINSATADVLTVRDIDWWNSQNTNALQRMIEADPRPYLDDCGFWCGKNDEGDQPQALWAQLNRNSEFLYSMAPEAAFADFGGDVRKKIYMKSQGHGEMQDDSLFKFVQVPDSEFWRIESKKYPKLFLGFPEDGHSMFRGVQALPDVGCGVGIPCEECTAASLSGWVSGACATRYGIRDDYTKWRFQKQRNDAIPIPAQQCMEYSDWHPTLVSWFTCDWYAAVECSDGDCPGTQESVSKWRCEHFGSFANWLTPANTACCACRCLDPNNNLICNDFNGFQDIPGWGRRRLLDEEIVPVSLSLRRLASRTAVQEE